MLPVSVTAVVETGVPAPLLINDVPVTPVILKCLQARVTVGSRAKGNEIRHGAVDSVLRCGNQGLSVGEV